MSTRWWLAVVAASTVYFGTVTEADNDLWMHLFVGRWIVEHGTIPRLDTLSYTALGAPWVDHEWLWQVLAFASFTWGGSRALLVGKFVLAAASVALLAHSVTAVRRAASNPLQHTDHDSAASSWLWGIVFLVAVPALGRGWAIRPQLISYLLLPGLVFALAEWERGRRWPWVLVPAVFAAWVNLHGGFVLGIAVLGVFTAVGLTCGIGEFARRGTLAALSFAATFANPYGLRLYSYLVDELTRSHPITEWQPVGLAAEHGAFLLLAVAFVLTLPWLPRNRTTAWGVILALAALFFAVQHQRHTPVFVLTALPLLRLQVEHLLASLGPRDSLLRPPVQRAVFVGVAAIACVQLLLSVARLWRDVGQVTFDPHEYPVAAVRALQLGTAQGNVAVPLDWGGYVLWHLAPAVRPSLDGRFATVYPEQVVADNFAFFRAEPEWRRLLEAYPTHAVLLPAGRVHPLQREPNWQLTYADGVALLFVRQEFLSRFHPITVAPEASNRRFFP